MDERVSQLAFYLFFFSMENDRFHCLFSPPFPLFFLVFSIIFLDKDGVETRVSLKALGYLSAFDILCSHGYHLDWLPWGYLLQLEFGFDLC